MTKEEVLSQLEALYDEKRHRQNANRGVTGKQYGAKNGDLRKIAKKIKKDHKLALELWDSEIYEARLLTCLCIDVNALSIDELESLVGSMKNTWVSDWMNSYVIKNHELKYEVREKWMASENHMVQRAGWNLTSMKVSRKAEDLDYDGLLDRLEKEMPEANELAQWTMNFALANIGIHHEKHRERALQLGEKMGIYSEYPTAKGCTSPYAPIWINEMVSRQTS